ncbi:MAG: flagellar hook basal-body protein [Planctomycetota bacterium]
MIVADYAETSLVRGLSFLAERQAAIANNLANVDSSAYKRRLSVAQPQRGFDSMLGREMESIAYAERVDRQAGTLRETGHQFDVALDAKDWLRVQDDQGKTFYTRNGQLQVGVNGYLQTRTGRQVLDASGQPISLGNAETLPPEIRISPNGTISNPANNQTWGPIGLVQIPEPDALLPVGGGLYVDPANQRTTTGGDGVQQGFLEGSNVDSLQELVAMITVERNFAATQRALTGLGRIKDNLVSNILR